MDGWPRTSTNVVITKGQLSPCLRSKMVTALAATPKLSGLLKKFILLIGRLCCLTCLAVVIFQLKVKENMKYAAIKIGGHILLDPFTKS